MKRRDAISSQAQIEIATPADRVWELLSGVDRWPMWNPLVQQALLSGPFQPGSVFKWKSQGLTVISTLREVTPNQCLTWTGKAFGMQRTLDETLPAWLKAIKSEAERNH